ncbi:hypothetical protein [Proteiniphilum sp.]|uniref:hypothetical protein n=1 Tax=Proteiniphilum sp. TaxID=1926877 RepID=UPI002B212507|nr:hypothetical protein [Proteiniphilum sp.]MEA4916306.1 hypothetical protein [Proteiniphilum sp.]
MKYIIFEDEKTGLIEPVIFGKHTTHAQIKIDRAKPISAGFFYIEKGEIQVYGESESLGLKTHFSDKDYIAKVLLNMGTAHFIPGLF